MKMIRLSRPLVLLAQLGLFALTAVQSRAQFDGTINQGLVGVGRLPATDFDRRGDKLDSLGGTFSSLAFDLFSWSRTGASPEEYEFRGTLYGGADRGFGDGTRNYLPRIQTFQFAFRPYYGPGPAPQSQISLTNTATLLLTYDGLNFTGFDPDDLLGQAFPRSGPTSVGGGRRSLDAEGLVRTSDGGYYVSDEYEPTIHRFDANGVWQYKLVAPPGLLPKLGPYPGISYFTGTNNPTSGRRTNRGFEGLTLTPDGKQLVTILQSPAIQDGGAGNGARNTRILVYDVAEGSPTFGQLVREHIYQLTLFGNTATNRNTPICEILAINNEQFLILERDGIGLGAAPAARPIYKQVVLASLTGATNIANTGYDLEAGAPFALSLPAATLPSTIAPVARRDFVDLIDAAQLAKFGLNLNTNQDQNTIAEKWEGLTLIPVVDGGKPDDYFLLVGNDNDFKAPLVYHNGEIVGTNEVVIDNMLLAFRVTLPGYGAPAPAPLPPGVVITGPTNATLSAPADFTVTADAYDADGRIVSVEFFRDGVKAGTATEFPFQLPVTNLAAGNYTFTAVATDHQGLTATSTVRTVTVTIANLPAVVTLTGPTNATLSAPAAFTLSADVNDLDGRVISVAFLEDNNLLGQLTRPPYAIVLTNVSAADHVYQAVAVDNHRALTYSAPVTVSVTAANLAPAVTITSPTNGAAFAFGSVITVNVSASDADGAVKGVTLFRGVAKVGEKAAAPFTFRLTNDVPGSFALQAVATDNQNSTNASAAVAFQVNSAGGTNYTLQILHASDFEAGIEALEDAPRFASVLEGLKRAYPTNTLVLSSGNNYVTGPFFTASADPAAPFGGMKGRGDIVLLNALGVQASVLGNNEFDDGPARIASLVRADPRIGYAGTLFPYLSANLDFGNEPSLARLVSADGQIWSAVTNQITRSTVIISGGERVGIVGLTTPQIRFISSPGAVTVDTNVVATTQAAVDALTAQGINKIVVLSSSQSISNEYALAQQLRDVDLVIAGGSSVILSKPGDRLRPQDARQGDYPMSLSGPGGQPVYVVNVHGFYSYVGRFVARFDQRGVITGIDDTSGVYVTDADGVTATGSVPPPAAVTNVIGTLGAIIDAKDGVRSGRTEVYLNATREDVRTQETNLGDLTADANLWRARAADPATSLSLKNGGGIGDSIGAVRNFGGVVTHIPPPANPRVGKQAGEVSQLDIENALRFNNALTLITITAQQLRDAMEWAVAADGTPGQFPQLSGLTFSFDATRPPMTYNRDTNNVTTGIATPGQRLRSLVATRSDGRPDLIVEKGQLVGDPNRTFRMVTIEFMANGGDGYYSLSQAVNKTNLVAADVTSRLYSTEGAEQKALADYLTRIGVYNQPDVGPEADERIQNLALRADSVLAPRIIRIAVLAGECQIVFTTLPGKTYQLESGPLGPLWVIHSERVTGDGAAKAFQIQATASRQFFRVRIAE